VTALTDDPTVAGTARYVLEHLGEEGEEGQGETAGSTFARLLEVAREEDTLDEFAALITAASRFRPSFQREDADENAPRPVRLAEGEEGESNVVLFPSAGPLSGPHEYVKLAGALSRCGAVLALPLPGFKEGERPPADMEALAAAAAAAIAASDLSGPLVLAGHSSGGWFAQALAGHLEAAGAAPLGLVLLDTYMPDSPLMRQMTPAVFAAADQALREGAGSGDVRLTATGAYQRVIREWEPSEIVTPTALIRATEPLVSPNGSGEGDWRSSWDLPHSPIDAAGDHFTMMTDHVAVTAEVVSAWIVELHSENTHTGSHSAKVTHGD
jgi:pimeloyl-ACP methyl ester carboxylesterase